MYEADREDASIGVNSQNIPLLKAATNIDPNPSKGGGDIIVSHNALVSETGPSGSIANIESAEGGEISIYMVREDDSLSQIAKMFGVSVNTILWANEIKSANTIQPGDELLILPITGVSHIVKKGDTLESIAKKYKGDVADIAAYNRVDSNTDLAVGDVVVVPNGEIEVVKPKTPAKTASGGTSVAAAGGGFTNPAPGSVRTQGIHGYNAVDLAAAGGTPIVAAAGGEIIVARGGGGWNGGYGNYIVIKHANGTQTLYAHMSRLAVVSGTVAKGEVIGYMGQTGRATGIHLHFEVRGGKNPF